MKKLIFITLFYCSLNVGCAKDTNNPGKGAPRENPISVQNVPANSCISFKSSGKMPDGSNGYTTMLFREYLSQADQSIYIFGQFPQNYVINEQFSLPTRSELVKNAAAWKWEVGPAKDSLGNWTKIRVFKEILYAIDGESYYVDKKIYSYGDPISFTDPDTGIVIQCNIPVN